MKLSTGLEFPVNVDHFLLTARICKSIALKCDRVVIEQRLNHVQIVAHMRYKLIKERNCRAKYPQPAPNLSRHESRLERTDLRSYITTLRTQMRALALIINIDVISR